MKRYNEMTPEELVALTEDQVRRLIDIEVAFAAIKPAEAPQEPTLETEGITASIVGYKVGDMIFALEADAQIVAALPAMKSAYSYNISYNYCWLERADHKVEKVAFYRQDDVLRIARVLEENERKRSAYNREKSDYDTFLRKITNISDGVWSAVGEAKKYQREIEAGKRAYQKYLSLADGDHKVASNFFRDAFKDEEELVKTVMASEYVDSVQCALPLENPEQKGTADEQ